MRIFIANVGDYVVYTGDKQGVTDESTMIAMDSIKIGKKYKVCKIIKYNNTGPLHYRINFAEEWFYYYPCRSFIPEMFFEKYRKKMSIKQIDMLFYHGIK